MRWGNRVFTFAVCSLAELFAPPVYGPVQQPNLQINEFLDVLRPPSATQSMLAQVSIPRALGEIDLLTARYPNVFTQSIYGKVDDFELIRIDTPALNTKKPKILITAGVHGNEHLGTLALLEFLHQFAKDPKLNQNFQLSVFPMMNPKAIKEGRRRPEVEDFDFNRLVVPETTIAEIKAFQQSVQNDQFDMALDLHGGPSRTEFFVISETNDKGLAMKALEILPDDLKLNSNDGFFPGRSGTQSDPKRYFMPTGRGYVLGSRAGTVKTYLHSQGIADLAYTLEYPLRLSARTTNMNYAALVRSFFLTLQDSLPASK